MQNRIFSIDDGKAAKAQGYNHLNAIHYMAPANAAGVGNLCVGASPECIAFCLGMESGQASMRKEGETNSVVESRIAKARRFMRDRQAYMQDIAESIAKAWVSAASMGFEIVIRLNGSTDISWEGIRIDLTAATASKVSKILGRNVAPGTYRNLMELFPQVQFLDYTKIASRMTRKLPANYYLIFSRHEQNEAAAVQVLKNGGNVAVVFETLPEQWHGFRVINGDKHDLRHLDPVNTVAGLTPKGWKAKRSMGGFVVRNAA